MLRLFARRTGTGSPLSDGASGDAPYRAAARVHLATKRASAARATMKKHCPGRQTVARIATMLCVGAIRWRAMLRSHGEDEPAEPALSVTVDELRRIGELGECYAFSKRAMATGGSMGSARAFSMATIDVLEGTSRDLR